MAHLPKGLIPSIPFKIKRGSVGKQVFLGCDTGHLRNSCKRIQ
jgi:hypothetical protein